MPIKHLLYYYVRPQVHLSRLATFNYAEVTGALRVGDSIQGVRVRDLLSDDKAEFEVRSRIVINASGAWFDSDITSAAFGTIRSTFPAQQIQLALKFSF